MNNTLTRRAWLAGASSALAAPALAVQPAERTKEEPFGYCLNLSTIQGQKQSLPDMIDTAARAGYHAIEPWIRDIDQHVKNGGTTKDLAKRLRDHGLQVPSAIAFPEWIVDDETRRKKAIEETRRSMDLVQQLGGTRLAAPPAGATNLAGFDLKKAAERYRALLELGDQMGIVAELELWGFSKCLNKLSDAVFVALETDHPKACVLPDVYHLYKGGSGFNGIKLLGPATMHVLHMNDYPAKPPRAEITDAQRIYPGDGIAPFKTLLRDLQQIGFRGMLSLELFNREYWQQDALAVARMGLDKMRAVVKGSLS